MKSTRAKISVRKLGKELLPYDYQHFMAEELLQRQKDEELEFSTETYAGGGFKYYTFSYIRYESPSDEAKRNADGKGLQLEEGYFILSSPDEKFIRSFGDEFLAKPDFYLGGVMMRVENVKCLSEKYFNDRKGLFKMISPLNIKTMKEEEGRVVGWDLYPSDGKFYEKLRSNLAERYLAYHGKEVEDDHFQINVFGKFKPKRHSVGKFKRRGSLLTFHLETAPELMKFGYDAGFGEETCMGFGCAELLGRRRTKTKDKNKITVSGPQKS